MYMIYLQSKPAVKQNFPFVLLLNKALFYLLTRKDTTLLSDRFSSKTFCLTKAKHSLIKILLNNYLFYQFIIY